MDSLQLFNINEVIPSSELDFDELKLFIALITSLRLTSLSSNVGGLEGISKYDALAVVCGIFAFKVSPIEAK